MPKKRTSKKVYEPSAPVVSQQQNAWHPVTIRELSEQRHRFNIDPPFQRKQAWTRRQYQQLYETMLRGRPIGTLEGYKEDPSLRGGTTFGIIDGHQRITAILDFVDNKVKTWTHVQKLSVFPDSGIPIQGGRFFKEMVEEARNYLLDYRIDINIIPKLSDQELVERFLEIQCHAPLTAAERLYAYPSKAKNVSNRIAKHPFWEQFHTGETNRGQLYQSSLYLIALEMSPDGIEDLRSGFIGRLASGKYDDQVTLSMENTIKERLDNVCNIFTGMQFTDRVASVVMYQSVMRLTSCGYVIKPSDRGKLAIWMGNLLQSSKRSSLPIYHQEIQKLLYASAQRKFWAQHEKEVLVLFEIFVPEEC